MAPVPTHPANAMMPCRIKAPRERVRLDLLVRLAEDIRTAGVIVVALHSLRDWTEEQAELQVTAVILPTPGVSGVVVAREHTSMRSRRQAARESGRS